MSTEVGLRTQYLNWREHFPTDLDIEPEWIVVDFWKEGGLIERLPIPAGLRGRIRGHVELSEGLAKGPFHATFIAVHSMLVSRPNYVKLNPCFMTFDVTPKQMHDFGDFYGKYPSKIAAVERVKHQARAASYQACRLLFPWSNWAADSSTGDYGASPGRVRVAPPGVDLDRWVPSPKKPNGGVCELLFVGGDFERKGGPLLLEWAKNNKSKDWRLNIVTRNPVDTNDERIVVHNGLMSNDPMLVQLYRSADLFVLPTIADCYSLASIEALASGIPVILSAIGGTPDVIKHGETGYLVSPGDVAGFSDKLDLLIGDGDLRRSLGEAARADAEARYDSRKNVRNTVLMMKECL